MKREADWFQRVVLLLILAGVARLNFCPPPVPEPASVGPAPAPAPEVPPV